MLVTTHKAYPYTGRPHSGQKAREPKFSGVNDTLANWFKPITEQFVYGFFAQDVVALWIPRIINALRRGRIPYDPREDPSVRQQKPLQQLLHSIYLNAKGLNRQNAMEESLREIETGPGLLIGQSILLGAASMLMMGKLALNMGQGDLNAYKGAFDGLIGKKGFAEMLQKLRGFEKTPVVMEEQVLRRFMKEQLLEGHFKPGLGSKIQLASTVHSTDADKALVRFLQLRHPGKTELTYKEALETWITRWASVKHTKGKLLDLQHIKQTEELESHFKRLTYWFNEKVLKVTDPTKLNILKTPGLPHHPESTAGHLLENIRKFRSFVTESLDKARKFMPEALQAEGWGKNFQNLLKESSQSVLVGTTVRKFALGLAASILAGVTVVMVSSLAQRKDKKYPANRNLDFSKLNGGQAMPAEQGSASRRQAEPLFQGMQCQNFFHVSHQKRQPGYVPAAVPLFKTPENGVKGGQR